MWLGWKNVARERESALPPDTGMQNARFRGCRSGLTAGCQIGRLNDEGHGPDGEIRGSPSELFKSGSKPFRHVAPGVLTDLGRFGFLGHIRLGHSTPIDDPRETGDANRSSTSIEQGRRAGIAGCAARQNIIDQYNVAASQPGLCRIPHGDRPESARSRSSRPNPPRLGVCLRRTRASTSNSPFPILPSSRASSAAWL